MIRIVIALLAVVVYVLASVAWAGPGAPPKPVVTIRLGVTTDA